MYKLYVARKEFSGDILPEHPDLKWELASASGDINFIYRLLDLHNYDLENSTKLEVYTGEDEFPCRVDYAIWQNDPVVGSRCVAWSVRKALAGDIICIDIPYMDRACFKVHNCIKDGYYFRVVKHWYTKAGTEMFELEGVQGYKIPWRNKVMAKWCEKSSLGSYYADKYPIRRLMNYVARKTWRDSFKD